MLATHQSCLLKPGDCHAPALCYISLPRQSASTHSAGYGVALLFPAHLTSWSTHPLSTPLPGCNWLCFAARCCWRVAHLFFFFGLPRPKQPATTTHRQLVYGHYCSYKVSALNFSSGCFCFVRCSFGPAFLFVFFFFFNSSSLFVALLPLKFVFYGLAELDNKHGGGKTFPLLIYYYARQLLLLLLS